MQQRIATTRANVSPRPVIAGWRMTSAELHALRQHVTVDIGAIPAVLPWLSPAPPSQSWRDYVSPVDVRSTDLPKLFHELALTICQFGGFIGYRSDGTVQVWKRDGSGVKAILATMADIRSARLLPGIDIFSNVEASLARFFIGAPFAHERLQMLAELGRPRVRAFFALQLQYARRNDGSYDFCILNIAGLKTIFPKSFGTDPLFYKKASLLLMTMEIALRDLGFEARALTPPPADYRIPQILEGLGILRFSDAIAAKLQSGYVFKLHEPEVRAIRAMAVEAVGLLSKAIEGSTGRPISTADLDSQLYLLSRNRPLMERRTMKPHMLVATAAF